MKWNAPWSGEDGEDRRAVVISFILHVLIILLAILPLLHYPVPPPGMEGVEVVFGEPDAGGEPEPESLPASQAEPMPEETPAPAPSKPAAQPQKVVTADDPEAKIRMERAREEARRREEQRALEAQEAEKKRQAEEAARRAAEEKARKDKEAQAYRDLMNPSGKGSGSGTKSGTQGSPEGQAQQGTVGSGPGTGKVGAGLSNRGIRNAPKINDRSQKTGRVVIEVCVDRNGRVVKADYTQRGSTTNDAELIELSKRNAMNFTFSPSDVDEQCGTISYDFKVR